MLLLKNYTFKQLKINTDIFFKNNYTKTNNLIIYIQLFIINNYQTHKSIYIKFERGTLTFI